MKVVFLEDVEGVAQGGEIKEVKPGFARNYLIPKQLAVIATHDSLLRLDKLRNQSDKDRIKKLNDMTAFGEKLSEVRVDLEMRSGPGGRLYGSVTNTIVATKLSELLDTSIDRRIITIPDSIRNTGYFTAKIKLHQDVNVDVELLVHPTDIDPETFIQQLAEQESSPDETNETEAVAESSEIDNSLNEVDDDSSIESDTETNKIEESNPQNEDQAESEQDSDTDGTVDEKKS